VWLSKRARHDTSDTGPVANVRRFRLGRQGDSSARAAAHACEQAPTRRVRIVHLSAPVFDALAEGDLATANALSPVPLSAHFAAPDWRAVWQMRSRQLAEDPDSVAWVTGVIWDDEQTTPPPTVWPRSTASPKSVSSGMTRTA
jgi:hypothetical protein